MNKLTAEQLKFLKKHNIDLNDVFDAQGLSRTDYKLAMTNTGKFIAYNTPPCTKAGHTMKTKSGHCCMCATRTIAFQKRNQSAGISYIAGTLDGNIIKIGFSKAVEIRSKSLNTHKYAGFNDWKILFAVKSEDAGRIENKANLLLYKYLHTLEYNHDGYNHDSHETFQCSFSKAKQMLLKGCEDNKFSFEVEVDFKTIDYEFKNVIKSK
jgi:hypothetical protein